MDSKNRNTIYNFDFFIPYVINHLQTESFIVNSIKKARKFAIEKNTSMHIRIRPQQIINTFFL